MATSGGSARPLTGLSVLIAEDSWHIADALRAMVERAGATTAGMAATLAEAETLTATARYDAAIMDLNLRDELAHGLVERLADRGVKVIVISGYKVEPALAAKVHAVLSKPAAPADLIAALAGLRTA